MDIRSDDIYVTRANTGIYYLWVPLSWFVNVNHIFCVVNGMGSAYNAASAVFANVFSISTASYGGTTMYRIEIRTADDSSLNDGGFHFMLYNLASWDD